MPAAPSLKLFRPRVDRSVRGLAIQNSELADARQRWSSRFRRLIVNCELPNPGLFPFAGELQGALADGGAEGSVGGDGVEPFGLRLALVSQEVNQTQGLTRSARNSQSLSCSRNRQWINERQPRNPPKVGGVAGG